MAYTVVLGSASSRMLAKVMIDRAPEGYVLTLKQPARTMSQNDFMWSLLTDLSVQKPMGIRKTPEGWKCLVMHACGHKSQFEIGLDGEPFPVGFRSSKLTKKQMADLITFIIQYGDENGIRWTLNPAELDTPCSIEKSKSVAPLAAPKKLYLTAPTTPTPR
jgi:NinB protein